MRVPKRLKRLKHRLSHASIRTLAIAVVLVAVPFLTLVLTGSSGLLRRSLENRDTAQLRLDVSRFAKSFATEAASLQRHVRIVADWDEIAEAVDAYLALNDTSAECPQLDSFWSSEIANGVLFSGFRINLVALYDPSWRHIRSIFWEDTALGEGSQVRASTVPTFFRIGVVSKLGHDFAGLLNPPGMGGTSSPALFVAVEAITYAPTSNATPAKANSIGDHGYLLLGRTVRLELQDIAEGVPVCVSGWMFHDAFDTTMPEDAANEIPLLSPMSVSANGTLYGGNFHISNIETEALQAAEARYCPRVPLLYSSRRISQSKAAYIMLSDGFTGHPNGPLIRVDRQRVYQAVMGSPVLVAMHTAITAVVVAGVVFFASIEFLVVRRLQRLKKVELDDSMQFDASQLTAARLSESSEVLRRAAATAAGMDDGTSSQASFSSFTSFNSPRFNPDRRHKHNEVMLLRNAFRGTYSSLVQRFSDAETALQEERRKSCRHLDALQILNLWKCRKCFPGMRDGVKEDPRVPRGYTLELILANPIALEFLKSFCKEANDGSLERLFFLLDVSWLAEMELAEEPSLGPAASKLAASIKMRYFTPMSPRELRLGSKIDRAVRRSQYSLGMFLEPFNAVRLEFETRLLQRFRQSTLYDAMCETLDVEAGSSLRPPEGTEASKRRLSDERGCGPVPSGGEGSCCAPSCMLSQLFSRAFSRLQQRILCFSPAAPLLQTPPI